MKLMCSSVSLSSFHVGLLGIASLLLAVPPTCQQDCNSGGMINYDICTEWMLQYDIINFELLYNNDVSIPSPVSSYTEITRTADVFQPDVFSDTCQLLAIHEVMKRDSTNNCELLQKLSKQIMDLCLYVCYLLSIFYFNTDQKHLCFCF